MIRTTILTKNVLALRGSIRRAHVGRPLDPGYGWFGIEANVLAWADGPLPAPFRAVAPRERVDVDTLAQLDAVLAESMARAKDREPTLAVAKALRRIVGLRVSGRTAYSRGGGSGEH